MSMFVDIEPLHKAAKDTSTLAGLNIYRQLHLCTVLHLAVAYWHLGLALATDLWLYKYLLPFIFILLLHM
jgi:hypothetical protein